MCQGAVACLDWMLDRSVRISLAGLCCAVLCCEEGDDQESKEALHPSDIPFSG